MNQIIRKTNRSQESVLTVENMLHGIRIDQFLARHFRHHPADRFLRMVRSGAVTVDDQLASTDTRVHTGEQVRVRLLEPPDPNSDPDAEPLRILYDDPWMIAIDKPAGVIAHPVGQWTSGTVLDRVQVMIDRQTAANGRVGVIRPGIVHRLDRMTSGVQILAKEHRGHRSLGEQFAAGRISKRYLAMVHGRIESDEFHVDAPIGVRDGETILMTTRDDADNRKPARTRFRTMLKWPAASLVQAIPETGRLHQIRVHLASVGHPVLGDEFYATSESERLSRRLGLRTDSEDAPRHLLHAMQLTVKHPVFARSVTITSPLPDDFRQMMWQLPGVVGE